MLIWAIWPPGVMIADALAQPDREMYSLLHTGYWTGVPGARVVISQAEGLGEGVGDVTMYNTYGGSRGRRCFAICDPDQHHLFIP